MLYAFPPLHLIRPTVDKACADRAKCVLIVPVSILACYWEKLLAASVLPLDHRGPDGFIRIRSPAPYLLHAHGFAPSELAIFVCDFGRLAMSCPSTACPPCPGAFARRPRPVCGSPLDRMDRSRLRDALIGMGGPLWTPPTVCFPA